MTERTYRHERSDLITRSNKPEFVVSVWERHPTCFPVGFDTSGLKDISTIDAYWAKFVNTTTGEVVDCADFAKKMEESR